MPLVSIGSRQKIDYESFFAEFTKRWPNQLFSLQDLHGMEASGHACCYQEWQEWLSADWRGLMQHIGESTVGDVYQDTMR